jgi:DNA-binding MarR family transcriptional regulator
MISPVRLHLENRFAFLVSDVARLLGRRFDRLARERLGLSRAQCRLLGVLALHGAEAPMSQARLADEMDMTPMGVAKLCERMEEAGWIARTACDTDRRVNHVSLAPPAEGALRTALALSDTLQDQALGTLSAAERSQLVALLKKVHARLAVPSPDRTA